MVLILASFEENLESEIEDQAADGNKSDGEPDEAESQDDEFTVKDAFLIGGSMVWDLEKEQRRGEKKQKIG